MPVEGILDHGVILSYPGYLREEKTRLSKLSIVNVV